MKACCLRDSNHRSSEKIATVTLDDARLTVKYYEKDWRRNIPEDAGWQFIERVIIVITVFYISFYLFFSSFNLVLFVIKAGTLAPLGKLSSYLKLT